MNRSYFVTLVLILSGFLSTEIRAQQYTRKESEVIMGGPLHDIIPCPGGDHIIITYPLKLDKTPNIAISRIDPQLALRYNNSLKNFPGFHYRGALYSNDRLFLITSDQGAVSRYEIDDKTGQIVGKPLALFSLVGKEAFLSSFSGAHGEASFLTGSSPDKNFHYCFAENIAEKKQETVQGVIMDKDMNITARFTFIKPEEPDESDYYNNMEVILSDKGILTIIYSMSEKTDRPDSNPCKYTLVQIDENGKTSETPLSGLPAGIMRGFSWIVRDNSLLFTALFAPNPKKGFTSIVGGRLDPASKKITDVRQTEITSLLANTPPEVIKKIEKEGIGGSQVNRSYTLTDGSRFLILERSSDAYKHESYRGDGVPSPYYARGSKVYAFRGSVQVLKLDPQNNPVWLDVVSKNQVEQDITLRIGIATTLDSHENLHIFFYDDKRDSDPASFKMHEVSGSSSFKTNSLACVIIAANGKMSKRFIWDVKDYEFHLEPESSLSGKGNVLFFKSIKATTAFTPEHLLNHSDFHFGTITIKD